MRQQLILISALTVLSQFAAFFKLWFTARNFGVGAELDAYNLTLVLPTFVSAILVGILQTGLFPIRAKLKSELGVKRTEIFERSVLWLVFFVGLLLAALISVSAELILRLLIPSVTTEVRQAFIYALPFMALLIVFNIVGDYLGFLLAIRDKFAYAAGAPILNGLLGGLILAVWQQWGLHALVLATLVGLIAQVLVCAYGLKKENFNFFGKYRDKHILSNLKSMLALGAWVLPAVFLSNVAVALPPIWAASFGDGAVSAFGYAYRLHSAIVQVLVMASSTFILANFAELTATGQHSKIRLIIRHSALASLLLGVFASAAVWIIGEETLHILFDGRFNIDAAKRVNELWLWLTFGLGFALLGNIFAKLWQAQSKPLLLSVMSAMSLLSMYLIFNWTNSIFAEKSISFALSSGSATSCLAAAVIWYKSNSST